MLLIDNKSLFLSLILSCVIYLMTCVLISANPISLFENILGFSNTSPLLSTDILAMPSSLLAFVSVIGKDTAIYISIILTTIFLLTNMAKPILNSIKKTTFKFESGIVYSLLLLMALMPSAGGYLQTMFILSLPILLVQQSKYIPIILMIYFLPLDFVYVFQNFYPDFTESYLTGIPTEKTFTLTLSNLLRPLALFLLLFLFTFYGFNYDKKTHTY